MPRKVSQTTELTSQYAAQLAADIERNGSEQERVSAEVAALEEKLTTLRRDQAVLVSMQQALGHQEGEGRAVAGGRRAGGKRPAAAHRGSASSSRRGKGRAGNAAKAPGKPTLVELVRAYLEEQGEPRSAAEVTDALARAHTERSVKNTVVRTTLENLVARGAAERSKQGSSVFYTVPGSSGGRSSEGADSGGEAGAA